MWNSRYSRLPTDEPEDDGASISPGHDQSHDHRLRLVAVCAIIIITPALFIAGKIFLW